MSAYNKQKSTHEDNKRMIIYAFNLILLLKQQNIQFQSLYLLFDYIVKSICTVEGMIELDNSNKIQHAFKNPINLPIVIRQLKHIGFLPENYYSLQPTSFLAHILNQVSAQSDIANQTSLGLNISCVDGAKNIQHTIISSSTSLGKSNMLHDTVNFYSNNNFESKNKKFTKKQIPAIGSIDIYKTIKNHLEKK